MLVNRQHFEVDVGLASSGKLPITALKIERFSFQVVISADNEDIPRYFFADLDIGGKLKKYATMRVVENVPSLYPCYPNKKDDGYLSYEKGLYPDLLLPTEHRGQVPVAGGETRAYMITVDLPGKFSGNATIPITLKTDETVLFSAKLKVHVIDSLLPKQTLINTQWFHGDCLATYYDVKVFSAKWWKIVKNFLTVAAKNGQNMILTPVFTPALDTGIGGERPTVQLVDVCVGEDGNYSFSYENLDKWLNMCEKIGFEY